ncbi:MAG: prepilin-type N-terminal cleavage/methylation domain-containing protein [Armatimonadetes bacterium]|nr:prepilin-type N-terminal cleavage/methylation domain-containing protein [Armatimonadota bacterium]
MRQPGGQSGFTLIELVVAVSLFTLVIGAALSLYQQGVLAWQRGEKGVDVQENLRLGLDRMSRELRTATALQAANGNLITFKTAYDNNKTVSYYYDAAKGQLMRKVNGGSNPLASCVTGLTFKYYNQYSNELPAPVSDPDEIGKITLVRITLEGKKGDLKPLKLTTSVRIRACE